MILQSKIGGDFKPHPEGIYPAVCVDVIDLGLMETEFQGQKRLVNKVRLVFETEQKNEEGKNCTLSKTFTASLNSKAKLAEFLGKWRGRPIVPGETIDLGKLLGACCTLVISQQQNMVGRTYASIDAVSKPTKKLSASGGYDPVLARQRIEEWKAKQASNQSPVVSNQRQAQPATQGGADGTHGRNGSQGTQATGPKSAAPISAPAGPSRTGQEFDPEVGF